MQIPTLRSISDIRREAKQIFDGVLKKDEVILVTKNNNQLSVILSPQYFQRVMNENESLWEELEMIRSKHKTKEEKTYSFEEVMSGKV